jgi:hypothetical protein
MRTVASANGPAGGGPLNEISLETKYLHLRRPVPLSAAGLPRAGGNAAR